MSVKLCMLSLGGLHSTAYARMGACYSAAYSTRVTLVTRSTLQSWKLQLIIVS